MEGVDVGSLGKPLGTGSSWRPDDAGDLADYRALATGAPSNVCPSPKPLRARTTRGIVRKPRRGEWGMTIRFLPNDPEAVGTLPARRVKPRRDRGSNTAAFDVHGRVAEGAYVVGSPEFLYWQVREAALWAVEAWEEMTGTSVRAWAPGVARRLPVEPDAGLDLNAYYDRTSLSFFHYTARSVDTFSGASTDVVAHETGHAILDSIRPDLWDTPYLEVGAFHEAFGDCVALVTGLSDRRTRTSLMNSSAAHLGKQNFLEATAEDLSAGIRRSEGRSHPAAAPRHALNRFRWALPTTMPDWGPPSTMIAEVHSLGRIFSGCFYDSIRNVIEDRGTTTSSGLLSALKTVAHLLAVGVSSAPEVPRFFQSVGRAMVLADRAENRGRNAAAISLAFGGHGVALGANAIVSPRSALAGPPPASRRAAVTLAPETRRDLVARMGPDEGAGDVRVEPVQLGDRQLAKAVRTRNVPLDALDDRLRGVVAPVPEPVLVGASGSRAALVSALPDPFATTEEVHAFVRSLLRSRRLAFDGAGDGDRQPAAAERANGDRARLPTHRVAQTDAGRQLRRVRFACST
jgi:hypothetical protein